MPRRRRKLAAKALPRESRAADICTVAWLLSALTALFCETVSLAAGWYAGDAAERAGLRLFSGYMLFAALVTGLFALALTAAVWRVRRVPPPQGVTAFAVVVGVIPWVVVLLRQTSP